MFKYYLATNINRNEPKCVKDIPYRHIKGRYDGNETLIRCKQEINDPLCQELTVDAAQELLNKWIDEENRDNPSIDLDGNIVSQPYLVLSSF